MTTKPKARIRIFEAVDETADHLHHLGFIDMRKMRKFDVLCLEPVADYDSEKIRALRSNLQAHAQTGANLSLARRRRNLTQAMLAQRLGTAVMTVRRMEAGIPAPPFSTWPAPYRCLGS